MEFSAQDLERAQELLAALFDEVQAQESTLAGGTKLGLAGSAIDALRKTRLTFGDPTDTLIRLTPDLFDAVQVDLHEIWRRQMREQFDFYYMTLAVSVEAQKSIPFSQLRCQLDFAAEGADHAHVIVQRLFPTSLWYPFLRGGVEMSLALDGQLSWSAGIDGTLAARLAHLPGDLAASITHSNLLKAYIALPHYALDVGLAKITATGEGNTFCSWQFNNPEFRTTRTITLAVVFKVSHGTPVIRLTGLTFAEPGWQWLTTSVRSVFAGLSRPLQMLLRRSDEERSPHERLLVGDHEQWIVKLPRPSR